jgi:hypothetical protein
MRWENRGNNRLAQYQAQLTQLICVGLCALFLQSLFFPSPAAFAFDPDPDSVGQEDAAASKPKRQPSVAFTRYAKQFKLICDYLEQDGRREVFGRHVEFSLQELDECTPCKALLRSLATACKVKAKAEPTPSPTPNPEAPAPVGLHDDAPLKVTPVTAVARPAVQRPVQREPNVLLLDVISQMGIEMAADSKRAEFAKQTFVNLTSLLRDPEELAPGANEYLDILAEYFLAPFSHIDIEPIDAEVDEGHEIEVQSVDDLFE